LLVEQESLIQEIVWLPLPILADEPSIMRQGLDTALDFAALRRALGRIIGKANGLPRRLICEQQLLARRKSKMGRPIKIGFSSPCL
jgi:hypothetical protein